MAEVKSALKEAKNAIKDKDYEAAVKHCKTALKSDRKNYQALVMFGRASQELEKYEDSKKVLLLASSVDPDSPVAWQGLAALCDKQGDIFTIEESITIYTRLRDIVKDDNEKVDSTFRKIASLYLKKEEPLNSAKVLHELVNLLTEKNLKASAWKSIIEVLTPIKNPIEAETKLLQESLEATLNDSVLGANEKNYQVYLRLLYNSGQLELAVSAARAMAAVFPTAYPLEWIARLYVETTADPKPGEATFPIEKEIMIEHIHKLLRLHKGSPWGNLAQGIIYQKENKLAEAKAHLRAGAERLPTQLLGWHLLLGVQMELYEWPGVETSCRRALVVITDILSSGSGRVPGGEEPNNYQSKLLLTQAQALSYMGHENHLKQAVDILRKEAKHDLSSGILLVRNLIRLKDVSNAYKELSTLRNSHGDQSELNLMAAILMRVRGNREQAISLLEELTKSSPNNASMLLELGQLYFEAGHYQKSLVMCLKAAKLDPSCGGAFLYLGHYYRSQGNNDKAKKCYEKALNINPCDNETGSALSDIYRLVGDHGANLSLLQRVTTEGGRVSCGWAWLRLGLHHLDQQEYERSCQALQYALQISPRDISVYECLGDAYIARGAHQAALKVFSRASGLSPDAPYPLYQIAHINQLVGEHLEALHGYEAVLAIDGLQTAVRMVALVGLAETLIIMARKHYENFFHANVKEDCLRAIAVLTSAAVEKASSGGIWKLLGDACSLLSPLPTSMAVFAVPARLMDSSCADLQVMKEVSKFEILQLGARCYALALEISPADATLWNDLAVNTFLQALALAEDEETNTNETTVKDLMQRAIRAVKKSLALDPKDSKTWISLGVMCAHKRVGDTGLSQHALVKSLELSPSVVSWTYLGSLYLQLGDSHLAHEAFSQAQALDPGYIKCWVGQALVAESIGHADAFDLFRHTTLLGIQVESCLGYSHHVTNLAMDKKLRKEEKNKRIVNQSIPTANDCMLFYTRSVESDVLGLNMSGLTLEMCGLHHTAAQSYKTALEIAGRGSNQQGDIAAMVDGIRCNLGRCLTALGQVEEAMEIFKSIKEPDFFTQCGLALASLKAGKFEDAYSGYTSALHWLAPDDSQKSHVLVALATLQYKFQQPDQAKTLLFQCSQLSGASIRGLLALAALGLISGDPTLTGAALAELMPHENDKQHVHHIAFLKAAQAAMKGNFSESRLILSRTLHLHPDSAPLWRSLSRHLLTSGTSLKSLNASSQAAAAATKLSQAAGENKFLAQDAITGVMSKLEGYQNPKRSGSLLAAQRAVLLCPGSPEAWATLIAAKAADKRAGHESKQYIKQLAGVWSKKSSQQLSKWLQDVSVA